MSNAYPFDCGAKHCGDQTCDYLDPKCKFRDTPEGRKARADEKYLKFKRGQQEREKLETQS